MEGDSDRYYTGLEPPDRPLVAPIKESRVNRYLKDVTGKISRTSFHSSGGGDMILGSRYIDQNGTISACTDLYGTVYSLPLIQT
jgi:hypothetical protein